MVLLTRLPRRNLLVNYTFVAIILTTIITNSRRHHKIKLAVQPELDPVKSTPTESSNDVFIDETDECFHARNDTIPISQYGNLPLPFLNLGMPKMGSSSLHDFFKCGNYSSSHYECFGPESPLNFCANCMKNASKSGEPLLSSCGNYEAFMQMDDGSFFPQIEYLDLIHKESPNATFLFSFRPMAGWFRSVSHWPPASTRFTKPKIMSERIRLANITGLPAGKGADAVEFSEWFCNRVRYVRDFVAKYPSHSLVEIDIMDPNVNERLGGIFGIDKDCWQQSNKNPILNKNENANRK